MAGVFHLEVFGPAVEHTSQAGQEGGSIGLAGPRAAFAHVDVAAAQTHRICRRGVGGAELLPRQVDSDDGALPIERAYVSAESVEGGDAQFG